MKKELMYNEEMRILGIDYGTKRIGLALSDEHAKIAFPKEVITNDSHALATIEKFAQAESVTTIVIGESRDFGGRPNPLMLAINKLKHDLERKGFTIRLQQEFSSSVEAGRFQGKNEKLDASAAAIILQRYLDKHINT